jgi:hypothetical protein
VHINCAAWTRHKQSIFILHSCETISLKPKKWFAGPSSQSDIGAYKLCCVDEAQAIYIYIALLWDYLFTAKKMVCCWKLWSLHLILVHINCAGRGNQSTFILHSCETISLKLKSGLLLKVMVPPSDIRAYKLCCVNEAQAIYIVSCL